jgi:choline-glycine betaine transporter
MIDLSISEWIMLLSSVAAFGFVVGVFWERYGRDRNIECGEQHPKVAG